MRDLGSIPGLGRSPGEEKVYPFQYSGLENSMDSPWDLKESDTTERLSLSLSITFTCIKEIASGELFFGTGNSARCSVVTQRGAMGCGRGV